VSRDVDDSEDDVKRVPRPATSQSEGFISKITNGLNDRPMNVTIGRSAPGLPDDSSEPIEATKEEEERIRAKFEEDARAKVKKEIEEQIEKPQQGSA